MNLRKLNKGPKFDIIIDMPELDTDNRKEKRRTRAAMGIAAVSASAGGALLSRNENSLTGRGLLGIGAIAGIAAAGFDAKSRMKEDAKKSQEALDKSVREFNMGRREGSPAIESFIGTVDSALDTHADWTKTMGTPDGYRYYQEKLPMQGHNGNPLTVKRGITGQPFSSEFYSVTVWEKGAVPETHEAKGVEYVVFSELNYGINPRRIIEGPYNPDMPLEQRNAIGTDADFILAAKYLASAEPINE